jgi:hypothetical protein
MIFAVLASIWSLIAFIIYGWKTFIGETHPNISSWAIWGFLTILNFTTYKKVTGSWIKSALPTANSVMTLVILFCAIRSGSFEKVSTVDSICFFIGLSAGLAWYLEKSPSLAQVILQVALVVGFIPTFTAAHNSPGNELWQSWALWTCSYVAQFLAVHYAVKIKNIEFLYPVNMTLCHGIVLYLIIR